MTSDHWDFVPSRLCGSPSTSSASRRGFVGRVQAATTESSHFGGDGLPVPGHRGRSAGIDEPAESFEVIGSFGIHGDIAPVTVGGKCSDASRRNQTLEPSREGGTRIEMSEKRSALQQQSRGENFDFLSGGKSAGPLVGDQIAVPFGESGDGGGDQLGIDQRRGGSNGDEGIPPRLSDSERHRLCGAIGGAAVAGNIVEPGMIDDGIIVSFGIGNKQSAADAGNLGDTSKDMREHALSPQRREAAIGPGETSGTGTNHDAGTHAHDTSHEDPPPASGPEAVTRRESRRNAATESIPIER